ncbi:hypothetical protein PENSTE_c012G08303 [Penicillium steckii]|uniref:EXPERA domain-containing protein n=1 Tax=Penicillium steckii TaxID=303698 RepID=A0A1V6T543_9EURO|nr:hypothetical protein PENSTE_c012G08303 [Penicillium steckii]
METVPHPYYPLGLKVVGYEANQWHSITLISFFASACATIFLATYLVVTKVRPKLTKSDLWTILWSVLSGCIHLFIEGYYVYNFRSMPSKQDIFGQAWKVYSLSDSRYQFDNAFVFCMETITAVFWGPLCITIAVMITTRHPLRFPLQAIVSLGQLYSDVLYYGTSIFDHYMLEMSYSRPEPMFFWGLFVFLNAFWIMIPLTLIWTSLSASKRAFTAVYEQETVKKVRKNR